VMCGGVDNPVCGCERTMPCRSSPVEGAWPLGAPDDRPLES
jgi:hypothetical protein